MSNTIPIEGATTNVYTVRTDEVSSIHYAVTKLAFGSAGAFTAFLTQGQQAMASSVSVAIASDQPTSTLKTLGDASKSVQITDLDDLLTHSKLDPVQNPSSSAQQIKGSAGRLIATQVFNTSASWRYLKLYNATGNPTSGSTPARRLGIPPGGGFAITIPKGGWVFSTGISYRVTTGFADNDANSASSGEIIVNFDYI